jgi:hypothetical protein
MFHQLNLSCDAGNSTKTWETFGFSIRDGRIRKKFLHEVGKLYTQPVIANLQHEHEVANPQDYRARKAQPWAWKGSTQADARGMRGIRQAISKNALRLKHYGDNGSLDGFAWMSLGDLADLAIYHWAYQHYTSKCADAKTICRSKDRAKYAEQVVLACTTGRAGREIWAKMAEFYHRISEQGIKQGSGWGASILSEEEVRDTGEKGEGPLTRGQYGSGEPLVDDVGEMAGAGVENHDHKRLSRPDRRSAAAGGCIDLSVVAAELVDALREKITPDECGQSLRPAGDLAQWAAGVEASPLGESVSALASPVELIIAIDASSSTIGNGAHQAQSAVAVELLKACRAAGHACAVAPWGDTTLTLSGRDAIMWTDDAPAFIGWNPTCGTSGPDAIRAVKQVRETSPSGGRARAIALILTDGSLEDLCETVIPPDMVVALWALGCSAEVPKDWTGPSMVSRTLDTVGLDLERSDLLRFLKGLGG